MKHFRTAQAVISPTNFRRLNLLAILICTLPAFASTNSGVDSAIGNQLNQSLSYPVEQLATHKTTLSRSPTGLLYVSPVQVELAQSNTWTSTFEIGALSNNGNDDAAQFRKYADWDEGLVLSNLAILGNFGETYIKFNAGGVGRDDQFLTAEYGRYGSFEISSFFTEIPHIYLDGATLLFQGIGTDVLSLPAPLVPGGNTRAEIANALTSASSGTVGLRRKKLGAGLRFFFFR